MSAPPNVPRPASTASSSISARRPLSALAHRAAVSVSLTGKRRFCGADVERARLLHQYALDHASADAERQRPVRRLHEAPPDGARVGLGVALCVLEGTTARRNRRM